MTAVGRPTIYAPLPARDDRDSGVHVMNACESPGNLAEPLPIRGTRRALLWARHFALVNDSLGLAMGSSRGAV
jgi:hypothetical protein